MHVPVIFKNLLSPPSNLDFICVYVCVWVFLWAMCICVCAIWIFCVCLCVWWYMVCKACSTSWLLLLSEWLSSFPHIRIHPLPTITIIQEKYPPIHTYTKYIFIYDIHKRVCVCVWVYAKQNLKFVVCRPNLTLSYLHTLIHLHTHTHTN